MTRFMGNLTGTQLRDDRGVYVWEAENGSMDRYTSVTRIIRTLAKPELLKWYARMEREYVCSRMQQVKRGEVKGNELIAEFDPKAPWDPAAEIYRDARANIGSAVHDLVCRYVLARDGGYAFDVNDEPEDIRPYAQSYHRWFEQTKPDYMFVEGPVFSRDYGYAGTCDGIAAINGHMVALDYKISAQTNRDHSLQLAAYRHANFIGVRNSGCEIDLPETQAGKVLLIHPDRCHLYDLPSGAAEFQTFLAALAVHEWQRTVRLPKEEF